MSKQELAKANKQLKSYLAYLLGLMAIIAVQIYVAIDLMNRDGDGLMQTLMIAVICLLILHAVSIFKLARISIKTRKAIKAAA